MISDWSQMWLPEVITSTPPSKISFAVLIVMPRPAAAFSPFATTTSSRSSSRSPGTNASIARRPGFPTMSPIKSTRIIATLRGIRGER